MTPESRSRSKGRLARSGVSLRDELNPLAIKLAIARGVIGASAPPTTAISASPERMSAAPMAMASSPDGQAEETVAALAHAPRRSAMILAAACGLDAPNELGFTRSGPGPLTW